MSAKGYVHIKFTAPRQPEGIYETWLTDAMKVHETNWPTTKSMGATHSSMLRELYHNSPRNIAIIEFASEDQAITWHTSVQGRKFLMDLIKCGTLDLVSNVYGDVQM